MYHTQPFYVNNATRTLLCPLKSDRQKAGALACNAQPSNLDGTPTTHQLENKQKFVFDEKDVASLPRAAVKPSSIQVDIEMLEQIYASVTF